MSRFDHRYADEMLRFRRAFARGDRAELSEAITDDFVWYTSAGEVIRGVDGVAAEIERRGREWSDVRFEGMVERASDGFVTQTFHISGLDRGEPFAHAAVDLYQVAPDGRIASKDTYWKRPARD